MKIRAVCVFDDMLDAYYFTSFCERNAKSVEMDWKLDEPEGGATVKLEMNFELPRNRRSREETENFHKEVECLYNEGLKKSEIAKRLRCSRAYISKIIPH